MSRRRREEVKLKSPYRCRLTARGSGIALLYRPHDDHAYRGLFKKFYDRLADHPDSGPPRRALGPNIRIGIVPLYVVIYDYEQAADLVTVLRIVHDRRRITGKLISE